jgi:hypothetical protein
MPPTKADEDAAVQGESDAGAEHRCGNGEDLEPRRLDPAPRPGDPQRERADHARHDSTDDPVADLLEHELDRGMAGQRSLLGLGETDRDEEQRDTEPVVEAALDVEPLSDPRGDPFVGHHGLPQRRVRARDHHCQDERFDEAHTRKHGDPDRRAGGDGQRQADQQQPKRY